MHRVSTIAAQSRTASVLVTRFTALVALAATIVVIVAMFIFAHSGDASPTHTIRPLPHNYFGR